MEDGRSALGRFLGFLFWLGIAYYFYHRDFAGAFWFIVACGGLFGAWLLFFRLWAARPRPSRAQDEGAEPQPRSDLPDYDFENVKPKDFE